MKHLGLVDSILASPTEYIESRKVDYGNRLDIRSHQRLQIRRVVLVCTIEELDRGSYHFLGYQASEDGSAMV